MPSTLLTSPDSTVNVINTGSGAGLYWNVGSSATLDTTTSFQGNILALTSIGLNTGANISCGRALAKNGAVTMDANNIAIDCLGNGLSGDTYASPLPLPAALPLLGAGLAGLTGLGLRRRKRG